MADDQDEASAFKPSKPAPETHDIRINAKQGPEPKDKVGGGFLQKRVGFLPVWGWAIVVIGTFVVWRYIQNKNASASAIMPDSGVTPSAAPTTPDSGSSSSSGSPTTPTVPGGPVNNTQWLSQAEAALTRLGYGKSLIHTSLTRYLAGEQLDAKEEAVIETAINLVGHPPVAGNFGVEVAPKPKPKKHIHIPPQVHRAIGIHSGPGGTVLPGNGGG